MTNSPFVPRANEFTVSSVYDSPRGSSTSAFRGKYLNQILALTVGPKMPKSTYKDTLRALINAMSGITVIDRDGATIKIKSAHGRQERSVAKLLQGNNVTLPIIAVAKTGTDNMDDRRRNGATLVTENYWDQDTQRAIRILTIPPRPVVLTYTINIWTKYVEDMDQITEQIRFIFNPTLILATSQSTVVPAYIDEESDESDYVVGDGQDRLIRKIITLNVETYIQSPKFQITSTGKIEEVVLDAVLYK